MLNKEEIEDMKNYFNECITKDTVYEEDLTLGFMKTAKEYINYLESREQKLIEKLEEESKQLENDILTMSTDTGNKYSLKLIHQAEGMKNQNDRILEILKKE